MARLGNYIEQIRGVSYKPEDVCSANDSDAIAILRANNIQDDGLNFDDLVFVKKNKVSNSQFLRKGDIVVCASSGSKNLVGKAAIAKKDMQMSFGAFCKVVRAKSIIAEYLGHYFQSPAYRNLISDLASGANINNIRNEHIDELDLPVPEKEIQEEISVRLDKICDLISNRKEQLEKLDLLVKSRFVELFDRYNGSEFEKPLNEICNFIDYRGKTPEKSDAGIPLITAKNVRENSFSIEPQEFIPEENYDAVMTRGFPRINDVLFTTEAPLGNVCRIPDVYDKFCVGQRIITMQPYPNLLVSEYLEYALLSKSFQDKMWQKASGSTVKGIRSKLLELLTISVPPIDLQNQFAEFVEQTDKLKFEVKEALEKLETLKKSLMQQYFG